MELTIKRKEAQAYLQRMQSVATLVNENDPDNKFGWAWQKNYAKFLAIEKANFNKQTPEKTKELTAYADDYRARQKEFETQYKANITANKGKYPPEVEEEWKTIEDEIGKKHPEAMAQIMAHQKTLDEYVNQEETIEIHQVAKPYHPKLSGQQITLVDFMLSESPLATVR